MATQHVSEQLANRVGRVAFRLSCFSNGEMRSLPGANYEEAPLWVKGTVPVHSSVFLNYTKLL